MTPRHADGGRGSDGVERRHRVGEQHEDERCARDERTKRGESGARIAAGEQADLDEIDAERDAVRYGLPMRSGSIGTSPMVALTGRRPATAETIAMLVSAIDGAKSALRRILHIDDVGAGKKGDLRLGRITNARQEQGHRALPEPTEQPADRRRRHRGAAGFGRRRRAAPGRVEEAAALVARDRPRLRPSAA